MQVGIRWFPLRQFDRRDAQTPDVRLRVVRRLLDDLRRHPERRTDERVPFTRRVRQLAGDAKIRQFHVAHLAKEDVRRLYIPMQFAFAVQIVQAFQHLAQYDGDVHLFEIAGFHQVQSGSPA